MYPALHTQIVDKHIVHKLHIMFLLNIKLKHSCDYWKNIFQDGLLLIGCAVKYFWSNELLWYIANREYVRWLVSVCENRKFILLVVKVYILQSYLFNNYKSGHVWWCCGEICYWIGICV